MKENEIEEGFWVFVSHSTKDFERVRLVRNALEDSGFRPILFYLKCMEDEDEINELLKREIDARRRFILCDSSNARASKYVQSEVDYIRSKRRMYEVVNLDSLDLNKECVQQDVFQLIKPFRKRTNVFLCYHHKDTNLVKIVTKGLTIQGFDVSDISFFDSQETYRYFGSLGEWALAIKKKVETTIENGYFLYLIGDTSSYFLQEELYSAYEFAPNMILPIVINSNVQNDVLGILHDRNFINLGEIPSDNDKAKAIVDALIDFDLNNNK